MMSGQGPMLGLLKKAAEGPILILDPKEDKISCTP
jgi:hypothetical protein